MHKLLSKLIVAVLLCGFILPGTAAAATKPPQTAGLSISPFLQQLTISPDDTEKTFTLTLTNNTSVIQELALSAQDFGSLNDTGGVLFEGGRGYTQKYGLVSWLKLEASAVVLQPRTSKTVQVTIDNRESLQPGGHYGAVIATVSGLDPVTGNKVALKQQLTSLLLVTKIGGAKYDLALADIHHNGNWLHLPSTVRVRFRNPGNVHVVPRGLVRLKNAHGTVVSQGIINDESAYVLPESYRQLYVDMRRLTSSPQLPGRYYLDVDYRYDGLNRSVVHQQAVNYLALPLLTGIFGLLALGIWQRARLWQWARALLTKFKNKLTS